MSARLLIVSSQKPLVREAREACARRGAEPAEVPSAEAARGALKAGSWSGVLADSRSLRNRERWDLLRLAASAPVPLVFLEPPEPSCPTPGKEPIPLLYWPLEPDLPEGVPGEPDAPRVFLADPTLYATGLLHERLSRAGARPVVVDAPRALAGLLDAYERPEAYAAQAGRAFLARWSGDLEEAAAAEAELKRGAPTARLWLVDSRAPLSAARRALAARRCALLPRRLLEPAVDLLLGRMEDDPTRLGRVLVVEPDRAALARIGGRLMEEGYDVAARAEPEEAIREAASRSWDIAVLGEGAARSSAPARLREADPELGLLLLAGSSTLEEALGGLSGAMAAGVEDCLFTPVDAARLKFSLVRAVERRRLRRENRRALEESLAARERLTRLAGFQAKFFAMVVHDVRSPLTGITGFAQMLAEKVREPELLEAVGRIRSEARALDSLVSDLVDYAAIESGKLRCELAQAEPAALLEEARAALAASAGERGVSLDLRLGAGLPRVRADPLRMAQVLRNLGANAIQFTPAGGRVELCAERAGGEVLFRVRDTGIGIPADELGSLFTPFFQGREAQRARPGGLGIGLMISREILRAHGGEIEAESPGRGAIFSFRLKAA